MTTALEGGEGSASRPDRSLPPGRPGTQEIGWAPGPVWTCAENLAHAGIRSLDRQARSQSLYRLRYPAQSEHGVSSITTADPHTSTASSRLN